MSSAATERLRWPAVVLVAATALGTVLGVTAMPGTAPVLVLLGAAQLAVAALALRADRLPVTFAMSTAAVCLGATLTDPRLAALAWFGAVPWIGAATAMATLFLYRHCTDRLPIAVGTAALVVGSVGVVAVGVRGGVPVATAAVAASVPYLVGALLAQQMHLRDARDDRTVRPRTRVELDHGTPEPATEGADPQPVRRALAIVALRADELVASTGDPDARRAATDLREVASRALRGTMHEPSTVRIELDHGARPDAPGATPAVGAAAGPPMPDLTDRERELLRLLATGASNAAIARSLYLSEATVKQYVSRLMRKLDRQNRTQLALMAARWFDAP